MQGAANIPVHACNAYLDSDILRLPLLYNFDLCHDVFLVENERKTETSCLSRHTFNAAHLTLALTTMVNPDGDLLTRLNETPSAPCSSKMRDVHTPAAKKRISRYRHIICAELQCYSHVYLSAWLHVVEHDISLKGYPFPSSSAISHFILYN